MILKTGDNVYVTDGRSRGKKGKILQVFPRTNLVVIEGVNERTRHIRSRRGNEKGQKISFFAPVHASNVMLVCGKCGKPRRASVHVTTDGKKQRVCTKCKTAF
ncbi:MAG: 50S ribosomal protein L24 [Patescibacteria group bacterium]